MWIFTKISTKTFVITRHMCHRCVYLLIFIIISVIGLFLWCTITPFIETDGILSFFCYIWMVLVFRNYIIHRSASKTFARWTLSLLHVRITSRAIFLLILSYIFKIFLCRMFSTSTKSAFFLNKIFYLIVATITWTDVKI